MMRMGWSWADLLSCPTPVLLEIVDLIERENRQRRGG